MNPTTPPQPTPRHDCQYGADGGQCLICGKAVVEQLTQSHEYSIAIAEACGWRVMHGVEGKVMTAYNESHGWPNGVLPGQDAPRELPDYLNDLNAMHEAEKMLNENQKVIFINFLGGLIVREHKPKLSDMTKCIHIHACHATAPQRAEAFLRCLNLWKEPSTHKPKGSIQPE